MKSGSVRWKYDRSYVVIVLCALVSYGLLAGCSHSDPSDAAATQATKTESGTNAAGETVPHGSPMAERAKKLHQSAGQ